MVQLTILSGRSTGAVHVIRQFPCLVGRAQENQLCLDDPGVWDRHLTLSFQKNAGIFLQTIGQALATVNGLPQTSVRLRNGDLLACGSAKLQFWLAPVPLRGLHFREICVWFMVAAVLAAQIFLIYWLGN